MQGDLWIRENEFTGVNSAGERLGYEGEELRQFVRESQAEAREARREAREAEKRRLAADKAREAEQRRLELQLRIEEARQGGQARRDENDRDRVQGQAKAPLPRLPKFDEQKDSMDAFMERFERFANCQQVLSDRGSQFTSDLMKEISRLIRVKQLFSKPYNPKCNGLCERVNGVLKAMLRKMCEEKPRDWDRHLPALLFAYREVPQVSTGFSPFELFEDERSGVQCKF